MSAVVFRPLKWFQFGGFIGAITLTLLVGAGGRYVAAQHQAKGAQNDIPTFQYDPTWPKPLPNNWITGNIGAMMIDSRDHVWVIHRPGSTTSLAERFGLDRISECCFPAPPVLEFDQTGNLVQGWGPIHDAKGQLLGKQVWGPNPDVVWPSSEHGIFADDKYVYVGGMSPPSPLLKFTRDGKYIKRFGTQEATSGNDTANFAGLTQMFVDPKTNELYVADGYRNRRIIVFDADTGAYKRHWGAYGHKPADGPPGMTPIEAGDYNPNNVPDEALRAKMMSLLQTRSKNFASVHCVVMSKDSLIYVCDRVNDRIQVFKTDGTFVKEGLVAPKTLGFGSVHGLAFSPDQRFLYVADGANKKVWILRRDDLTVLGSFSSGGRNGGQLGIAHTMAVDSKGNVYVGETVDNDRVQRFNFMGMKAATALNQQ
jgi:hypothetical protein